ncbi:MAG: cobalamin biosynthesis protein CbiD [Angelakisella sp.]|jgi:cobalt-precorrin-5B (C1)-methyltransferase|nr:cobalamin biosynthesis protein CbiD [Angelakisella sp.]
MELDRYKEADGRRLRFGWTTGSCAAAAARAAARALLTGEEPAAVRFSTPSGVELELPVECLNRGRDRASCGVRKDAGDDPDVTHGLLIRAEVRAEPGEGPLELLLAAGEGVGIVTLPGLDQPPGEPAINRVPREMILTALREEAERAAFAGRLTAAISVPGGKELAEKTFNPRLGILGGISILGTSGLVEPMSETALVASIRAELSVLAAAGEKRVILTPGNYGRDFLREAEGIPDRLAVKCGNFLGEALDAAGELGFREVLLAGHLGKLVKLAGGMLNTHSRYGDCRMELLASHAALAGASRETVAALFAAPTTVQAGDILDQKGLLAPVMASLAEKTEEVLCRRAGKAITAGAAAYLPGRGIILWTKNARAIWENLQSTEETI